MYIRRYGFPSQNTLTTDVTCTMLICHIGNQGQSERQCYDILRDTCASSQYCNSSSELENVFLISSEVHLDIMMSSFLRFKVTTLASNVLFSLICVNRYQEMSMTVTVCVGTVSSLLK